MPEFCTSAIWWDRATCGNLQQPIRHLLDHHNLVVEIVEVPHLMSRTSRSTPSRSGNFMAVPPAPCTCRHGIWASYRMNHRFCWIYSNSSQSSAISCISLLTFTIFYIVLLNENIFSVFFSMLFSMFLAMFLAFSASFSHSGANFWQWLHLNRLADRPADRYFECETHTSITVTIIGFLELSWTVTGRI